MPMIMMKKSITHLPVPCHKILIDKQQPVRYNVCNMRGFLMTAQLLSAVLLIIAVLMHAAKGEGLGGIGGAARLFGTPKGMEQGLDRITWTLAILFLFISILLAIIK
jgi:preprotein translocase subunit SecG